MVYWVYYLGPGYSCTPLRVHHSSLLLHYRVGQASLLLHHRDSQASRSQDNPGFPTRSQDNPDFPTREMEESRAIHYPRNGGIRLF